MDSSSTAVGPLSLFYSYSHCDEAFRRELGCHLSFLRRMNLTADWHDRTIGAGDDWKGEIDRNLASADIVLLLVSADFIASDYCWGEEMTKALARHDCGEARVIPVILRPCRWTSTSLAKLQAVPKDGKPVSEWTSRDAAFDDIAVAVERIIQDLREQRRRAAEQARRKAEEQQRQAEAEAKRLEEEERRRRVREAEEAQQRARAEATSATPAEAPSPGASAPPSPAAGRGAGAGGRGSSSRAADEHKPLPLGEVGATAPAEGAAAPTKTVATAGKARSRFLVIGTVIAVVGIVSIVVTLNKEDSADRRQIPAKETTPASSTTPAADPVKPLAKPEVKTPPATTPDPSTGTLARKPLDTFRDCPDCPELVVIPGGTFTMGSPADEDGRDKDEEPQHQVTVKPFTIGKTEVSRAQFSAFVDATNRQTQQGCYRWTGGEWKKSEDSNWRSPGLFQTDDDPVTCISWQDAQAFLGWLAKKTGKPYRLPTEAEWEYATRAGTTTPFSFGATIGTAQANYNGNYTYGGGAKGEYRAKSVPAGSLPANPWGLYEVHGNLWEWVEDCYHDSYQGAPQDGSAWVSGDCARRVVRGGSWDDDPEYLRSADRNWYVPDFRLIYLGFRVARTFTP